MGDDRCHRNQGTDKMEGMCQDHSQARSRVVWWEQRGPDAGRGRTKMSGPDSWGWFGAGGLIRVCPKERSLGGEGTRMFLNVTWGLPHSRGDSEDTTRTEGQRCRQGKSQLWHPRHGLVK